MVFVFFFLKDMIIVSKGGDLQLLLPAALTPSRLLPSAIISNLQWVDGGKRGGGGVSTRIADKRELEVG